MDKSVIDILRDTAEVMCADYCKYYARAKRYKPRTKRYIAQMEFMCEHICTKCPINNIY